MNSHMAKFKKNVVLSTWQLWEKFEMFAWLKLGVVPKWTVTIMEKLEFFCSHGKSGDFVI